MLLIVVGCQEAVKIDQDLESSSPRRRIAGLSEISRRRRYDMLGKVVEMLADPDPVVRVDADFTIRELTGWKYDYRPYWNEADRRDVIRRLRKKLGN